MRAAQRQRGLGKFEFAVVLTIFGVLAILLLDRLVALEHDTERLEVALTIRHIHVGLKLAIGERIMRGREADIPALLDENPLNFLGDANVGARPTAPHASAWTYDAHRHTLHYQTRQPEAFEGQTDLAWQYIGHRDPLGRMVDLQLKPLK